MHAIILFAHGSRDPLWHKPIQAIAKRIADQDSKVLVRCAYLELTEPDLLHVADELAVAGVTSICVVPLFLGLGKHAREDLPILISQVQSTHPKMVVTCQKAVGAQERLLDLLAEIALKGEA